MRELATQIAAFDLIEQLEGSNSKGAQKLADKLKDGIQFDALSEIYSDE